MQLIHTLAATAALLLAIATPYAHAAALSDEIVEPLEVQVNSFFTAVVVTAVSDKRNYANEFTQPICVTDVTRVREAVYNGTRDLFIEVNGCAVSKPRGLCGPKTTCTRIVPFEVNVVGPETTPGFDPVLTVLKGKPVKTPYAIRSIGLLL